MLYTRGPRALVSDNCTESPKMTLKTTRSMLPDECNTSIPRVPNINLFHSTASHSWVTGHFETSALNDSNWDWALNYHFQDTFYFPIGQNVKFQSFFKFLKFQNSKKALFCRLSQGTAIKKFGLKNYKCKRSSIVKNMTYYLRKNCKCCEWHPMTLNGMRSKIPHICFTSTSFLPSYPTPWVPYISPFCSMIAISKILANFIFPYATMLTFNIFKFL